jgi:hypothetical protein
MPFQSEKQRKYLHANHPEIAKRWERDYAGGGRIGYEDGTISPALKKRMLELLMQGMSPDKVKEEAEKQLRQDPYIKERMNIPGSPVVKEVAHGGLIPSHEAGIYGLNEGGRVRYFTGAYGDGGTENEESSTRDTGSDYGQFDRAVSRAANNPPAATSSGGEGVYQDRIIEIQDRQRRQDLRDIIERGDEEKYDNPLDKYSYTPQGVINRENLKQKQALDNWNAVKDTANTWAKKKAGKAVFDHFLLGGATFGLGDVIGGLVQGFKTNKAKNEFINTIKGSIAEYQKLGIPEHSPHTDTLIQDLNQQLLDLTQTRDRPDEDTGGDGVTGVASITYDDIEDTNRKVRASTAWRQEQEKVDRSKQMAYWRMMMAPYMSAKGGRVPAGYNTGGLSNLFRLKNV